MAWTRTLRPQTSGCTAAPILCGPRLFLASRSPPVNGGRRLLLGPHGDRVDRPDPARKSRSNAFMTSRRAASAYVKQIVHDNLDGVEVNCRSAVGKATKGLWECRWNEHFSNYKDCDKLEADASKK